MAALSQAPVTPRWNFSATIGKWQRGGRNERIRGHVRPIGALQALGEELGNPIGPQLTRLKRIAAALR
jgi:hypothetical protein